MLRVNFGVDLYVFHPYANLIDSCNLIFENNVNLFFSNLKIPLKQTFLTTIYHD